MAKGTTAKDLLGKSEAELSSFIADTTRSLLHTRFRNHANLLDDTSRIAPLRPDLAVPQLSDPDYKTRPVFREDDLRRHLINEIKADDKILEEDTHDDPRFSATPADLKKAGIEDFQLDYALKTVGRRGSPQQTAAMTPPMRKPR